MTRQQIEDLMDGVALLESTGNLYEYAGTEQGKYFFQCVSNDQFIRTNYESLFTLPEYGIQY